MRIGTFSFTPGLATTLAAAAALALLLSLGRWQLHRAAEKTALQALLEARLREPPVVLTGAVPSAEPLLYRRVRVAGEWLPDRQVFIDNRIREGQAGFHVVTPLRLEGGDDVVLVNRGWVARGPEYPAAPPVAAPTGHAVVGGMAWLPPARYVELSPETITGNVWQNLSLERYRQRSGLPLLPVVVLADAPGPGLAAIRERPDAGVAKHEEYALTWFSLAATVLVLWIALNLRRAR